MYRQKHSKHNTKFDYNSYKTEITHNILLRSSNCMWKVINKIYLGTQKVLIIVDRSSCLNDCLFNIKQLSYRIEQYRNDKIEYGIIFMLTNTQWRYRQYQFIFSYEANQQDSLTYNMLMHSSFYSGEPPICFKLAFK